MLYIISDNNRFALAAVQDTKNRRRDEVEAIVRAAQEKALAAPAWLVRQVLQDEIHDAGGFNIFGFREIVTKL